MVPPRPISRGRKVPMSAPSASVARRDRCHTLLRVKRQVSSPARAVALRRSMPCRRSAPRLPSAYRRRSPGTRLSSISPPNTDSVMPHPARPSRLYSLYVRSCLESAPAERARHRPNVASTLLRRADLRERGLCRRTEQRGEVLLSRFYEARLVREYDGLHAVAQA